MGFHVLTAEISHETNSFSLQEADEQAFLSRYVLMDAAAIAERGHANTEPAGFLDVGRDHGWHVNHVLSAVAGPSGKVRRATFDWLCDPIISTILQHQFDGLLPGLHGQWTLISVKMAKVSCFDASAAWWAMTCRLPSRLIHMQMSAIGCALSPISSFRSKPIRMSICATPVAMPPRFCTGRWPARSNHARSA